MLINEFSRIPFGKVFSRKETYGTKKLFPVALICALIISIIFSSTNVSAGSKFFLEVGYKGKTVTLFNGKKRTSLKTVQKAWGKSKTASSYEASGLYPYNWKAGKTKILIVSNRPNGKTGSMHISIKDKNGSMSGVEIGMTKAQALKILKKKYGSRNLEVTDSNNRSYIRIKTLDINEFIIKSDKVVRMDYFIA